MTCPVCARADVSEIRLTIRDRRVTMHSCVRCEQRWWDSDGEPVALGEVLDLVGPAVAASA
ncbi:MAG: hypothetical protein H0T70_00170 [Acidimicrobiia bacterium]|nr:hypothetical protein [Acidimicrobiia bacterium]